VLLPKRDAPLSECEDAIAAAPEIGAYAVADGATDGLDSRRWARRLTRAWTSRAAPRDDVDALVRCSRDLGDRLQARWAGRALPWYLEAKAEAGAFAAFVGLRLVGERRWEAVALGDSCLFVERPEALVRSFPVTASA